MAVFILKFYFTRIRFKNADAGQTLKSLMNLLILNLHFYLQICFTDSGHNFEADVILSL